ncbi:MAG: hypothetical protein LBE32_07815 [Burkholderiales bacterium]|nr:hypothetical protein [Burkholderiales bacterium]
MAGITGNEAGFGQTGIKVQLFAQLYHTEIDIGSWPDWRNGFFTCRSSVERETGKSQRDNQKTFFHRKPFEWKKQIETFDTVIRFGALLYMNYSIGVICFSNGID